MLLPNSGKFDSTVGLLVLCLQIIPKDAKGIASASFSFDRFRQTLGEILYDLVQMQHTVKPWNVAFAQFRFLAVGITQA